MDYHWYLRVQYPGGEETVVATGLRGSMPDLTRGRQTEFKLDFASEVPDSVSTQDNVTRYEKVRELLDWAGWATTEDGAVEPAYRERLPSDADVDSLVVEITPGADIQSATGVWGVVVDGDDPTEFAANGVVELQVYVLAEAGEYATYSDVETAFHADIV